MTDRERFNRWMHFEAADRAPVWEVISWWRETLERWQNEGMPQDVHPHQYFGLDRCERLPVSVDPLPGYKAETIAEDEKTRTYRDGGGVIKREFKDQPQTIPQFVRFPIETRADWEDFKARRLNPDSPARFPVNWDYQVKALPLRDFPVAVNCGSLFGWPRNWMGLENISYALYDDPDMVQDMARTIADLVIAVITRVLEQVPDVDYALFWEDMCYKSGCLISPEHFKKILVPNYQRITEVLHSHGIDVILVDCDGYHDEVLPLWLEGGLTGVYPLEVAAGEDPVELRKQYPELLMCGGIDKRELAKDGAAVKAEVDKKVPFLLEKGGWIPSVDHSVPYDVPLDNYRHYHELLHEHMGA